MKPPDDSRMADLRAAIDRLRKKPSWRATKAINAGPTKRRYPGGEYLPLLIAAGLIALIFLLGWLFGVR
jgi:hypothetical protein